jgi:elongation factor G
MRDAVLDGVRDALMCGPLLSFPLARLRVEVTACEAHADSTPEAFRSCAAQAVAHALAAAEPVLLEPVMDLEVAVDPAFVGDVLSDLTSRRRAEVLGVEGAAADGAEGAAYRTSTVRAVVPLASLVGYATALRSRTKGKAALQMEFKEYRRVGKQVLAELLANPP